MKIRYLYSLLALIGVSILPGSVLACSCGGGNIKDIVDTSQYIFVAEILSAKKNPDAENHLESVTATFEIKDVIKGSPTELSNLFSGYGGGDCGMPFLVGHKMLVFTSDGIVTMCGATRSLGLFENDAEYISLLKSYVENGTTFDFDQYPAIAGVFINCGE